MRFVAQFWALFAIAAIVIAYLRKAAGVQENWELIG